MTAPTAGADRGNWFTRGGWWFFVHLLSLGLFWPVPMTAAAVRSRRPGHVVAAVVSYLIVIGTVLAIAGAPHTPDGELVDGGSPLGALGITTCFLGGLVTLVVVRSQVFAARRGAGWDRPPPDPAIAAVLAARDRRTEARRLAAQDPLLARELRIGRPDLRRTYDDGGLVDLNSAPAPVIAHVCGIPRELAERIVTSRGLAGRFTAVDDVFAWADLPYDLWEVVRDRGVVVG
ncbi:hypothetical protein GCM10023200_12650 [Actinomycetospora chlora]|uniref:Helix-hairpin-helix domain-containing protein n=1 Tax=Actinomycetospora chlora TaxID=663608 RepID=A0ABP9AJH0_9PSEU